jgi:hypothetical protein
MNYLTTTLIVTQKQINAFGELSGDNGPVHSEDGIVQGGFIIGLLPKLAKQTFNSAGIFFGAHSVSMMLDAKFRNKLPANKQVTVKFGYKPRKNTPLIKLTWQIFDSDKNYCEGHWIVYKTNIDY